MGKIYRKKSNHVLLLLPAIIMINPLLGLFFHWPEPFRVALNVLLILTAGYLLIFRKGGWKSDYLQWDNHSLQFRDGGAEYSYNWKETDQVILRNDHLLVKSGEAGGYMMDLQGYSPNDLKKFQQFLQSQSLMGFASH